MDKEVEDDKRLILNSDFFEKRLKNFCVNIFMSFVKKFRLALLQNLGLFGNELLDRPEGFVELNKRVRMAAMSLIDQIEAGESIICILLAFNYLNINTILWKKR